MIAIDNKGCRRTLLDASDSISAALALPKIRRGECDELGSLECPFPGPARLFRVGGRLFAAAIGLNHQHYSRIWLVA